MISSLLSRTSPSPAAGCEPSPLHHPPGCLCQTQQTRALRPAHHRPPTSPKASSSRPPIRYQSRHLSQASRRSRIESEPETGSGVDRIDGARGGSGTFTRNVFKAAPVVLSNQVLLDASERGGARVQSVLVNSGCANAVTGEQGMADAKACVEFWSRSILPLILGWRRVREGVETMLLSTGVIVVRADAGD